MKKAVVTILCIAMTLVSATACSSIKTGGGNGSAKSGNEYSLEKIEDGLVDANTGFAFDIFRQLNGEDLESSIFISPLSISTALTMTYNGAQTTTKDAMARALGYQNVELDVLNRSYQNLLGYLENIDSKVELNIGNSIWIREGEKIKEDFLSRNRDNFNAEVDMLDFSKDSAAEKVNGWISDATRGKIKKMIKPPIPSDVVMYLINAIYFKGQWAEKFDPERTQNGEFVCGSGEKTDAQMMNRNGDVEYGKGSDYKAVRLPYGSGGTSMYCILPDEGVEINGFVETLDTAKWKEIRKTIEETEDVVLKLPRFKMEYGIKNLNDSLISLGMGEAFSDTADFSGIREGIFISKVLHKAVIEVNEEGSEAAAATVVVMTESCASAEEPVTFIADRPFVFVIADDQTGTVLFMGKLYNI